MDSETYKWIEAKVGRLCCKKIERSLMETYRDNHSLDLIDLECHLIRHLYTCNCYQEGICFEKWKEVTCDTCHLWFGHIETSCMVCNRRVCDDCIIEDEWTCLNEDICITCYKGQSEYSY